MTPFTSWTPTDRQAFWAIILIPVAIAGGAIATWALVAWHIAATCNAGLGVP